MARGILEIDGRRIELTDEQVEELLKCKEKKKDNYFLREKFKTYYTINNFGELVFSTENNLEIDKKRYDIANYCTDKDIMKQRALHEILDRLLWRFSMENDGDQIDWEDLNKTKFFIYYNYNSKEFTVSSLFYSQSNNTYFINRKIAERAIKEIIEPFMKEHPEFVW